MDGGTFTDLQSFCAFLEREGDLVRVQAPVDPTSYELTAILWELYDRSGPAVVFENVKGYEGIPVVSNIMGNIDRVAQVLGLAKGTPYRAVRECYFSFFDQQRWHEPQVVADAPCKEVILKGDDVDLYRLPVLQMHPDDGGAYITAGVTITEDPKGSLGRNVGIYREMVIGRNRIAMMISVMQDIGKHFARAGQLGQTTLPVAVCIGTDPYVMLAAESKLRARDDELALAGAFKGSPVAVVKCETNDLLVPASAEIVLEGEISLQERAPEGPFSEWHSYYEESEPAPVFTVKCITHRRNPLYQMTTAYTEGNFLFMFGNQYIFVDFAKQNASWIEDFHLPPEGRMFSGVVSINKRYPFQGRQTIYKLFSTPPTANYLNNLVVVDRDVNIYDLREVWWALSTKVDAERDVVIYPPTTVTGFNPAARARLNLGGDKLDGALCSKVGIDATTKLAAEGFERGFVKRASLPSEVVAAVRRRWTEYGFK